MNRGQPPRRRKGLKTTPFRPAGASTWPPRQAPLPAQGRRGRAIEADLDKLKPALLARSGGNCELGVPGICWGRGTDRAHRQRRTEHNGVLANLLWACRPCHRWTEDPEHFKTAKRHGFIVGAWENYRTIPVLDWEGRTWQP